MTLTMFAILDHCRQSVYVAANRAVLEVLITSVTNKKDVYILLQRPNLAQHLLTGSQNHWPSMTKLRDKQTNTHLPNDANKNNTSPVVSVGGVIKKGLNIVSCAMYGLCYQQATSFCNYPASGTDNILGEIDVCGGVQVISRCSRARVWFGRRWTYYSALLPFGTCVRCRWTATVRCAIPSVTDAVGLERALD